MPWLEIDGPLAREPRVPARSQAPGAGSAVDVDLTPHHRIEVVDGFAEIIGATIVDQVIELQGADVVEIVDSELRSVELVVGDETVVRVQGSVFDSCDLSRLRLESISRCRLVRCKFVGTDLSDPELDDLLFADCRLHLTNLFGSRLDRVRFEGGTLDDVDLTTASLRDVSVHRTVLHDVCIDRITAERVDLREAAELGLESPNALNGVLITTGQAIGLAHVLAHTLGADIELEADV